MYIKLLSAVAVASVAGALAGSPKPTLPWPGSKPTPQQPGVGSEYTLDFGERSFTSYDPNTNWFGAVANAQAYTLRFGTAYDYQNAAVSGVLMEAANALHEFSADALSASVTTALQASIKPLLALLVAQKAANLSPHSQKAHQQAEHCLDQLQHNADLLPLHVRVLNAAMHVVGANAFCQRNEIASAAYAQYLAATGQQPVPRGGAGAIKQAFATIDPFYAHVPDDYYRWLYNSVASLPHEQHQLEFQNWAQVIYRRAVVP